MTTYVLSSTDSQGQAHDEAPERDSIGGNKQTCGAEEFGEASQTQPRGGGSAGFCDAPPLLQVQNHDLAGFISSLQ